MAVRIGKKLVGKYKVGLEVLNGEPVVILDEYESRVEDSVVEGKNTSITLLASKVGPLDPKEIDAVYVGGQELSVEEFLEVAKDAQKLVSLIDITKYNKEASSKSH
jgi:hypothetical protein